MLHANPARILWRLKRFRAETSLRNQHPAMVSGHKSCESDTTILNCHVISCCPLNQRAKVSL